MPGTRRLQTCALTSALLLVVVTGCSDPPGAPDAAPVLQNCTLALPVERSPGAPFDVAAFRERVWPVLAGRCGSTDGGCHAPGNPSAFTVWSAGPEPCRWIETFNALRVNTDLRNAPQNSRALTAIDGTQRAHPLVLEADDPLLVLLRGQIDDAFARWNVNGKGEGPHVYFDPAVYADTVQPALDAAGCSATGCHDIQARAGDLGLHPAPAAGSAELTANFRRVTRFVDLGMKSAVSTRLHVRATDGHGGAALDQAGSAALAAWIQDALDRVDDGDPVTASCIEAARLDFAAFDQHVAPMLQGLINLEHATRGGSNVSCSQAECHGRDRGVGTYRANLFPSLQRDPVPSFESYRCFSDPEEPRASQLLACAFDEPACLTGPHVIAWPERHQDGNIMRLLGYLHASNEATALLDFAYFARRVNPIFDDPALAGPDGLTCAMAGCHGFSGALGALLPASDMALVRDAEAPEDLFFNFAAAARFVNTAAPEQSTLLRYAARDVLPGTGLQHPGEAGFGPGDAPAQIILRWLRGLRPDPDGFVRDVLLAGPFAAAGVTEEALPFSDEITLEPRLQHPSDEVEDDEWSEEWDGYFSPEARIDLRASEAGIPGAPIAAPRVVYAVVYLINTTDSELPVTLAVRSESDVHVRAGADEAVGLDGAGVDHALVLPPYRHASDALRVMVKVLERPGDASFGFTLQLTDASGAPLTEDTGEIVVRLHGDLPF